MGWNASDMVLESFRLENENEIIVRPRDIWHEYLVLQVAPMKFVTLELRLLSARAGKLVLVLVLQSKALYYLFSKQLLLVLDANSWPLP